MQLPWGMKTRSQECEENAIIRFRSRGGLMKSRKKRNGADGDLPGIADVAVLAGVSTASVSRVLNQSERVGPVMRKRVLAAIEQLGYVPDAAGRALSSRRLRAIGAIVPTLDNAIFASGIQALQRRLAQRNYTLLVASSEYDQYEELSEARALMARGVDAMMLVGAEHSPELYEALARKPLPFVNAWTYTPDAPHPSIGFDNRMAMQRVVNYLVSLGHRRIAMISGFTVENDRARERVEGVQQGLADCRLSIQPGQLLERAYDIKEGREAARMVLRMPEPPSAIICGNDILALGVLFEAQALGIAVPDALSIVGFDDLPVAASLVPALTTVRIPVREMGRRTADYLLDRLLGHTTQLHTELDADLIVRGTTAPPSAA